MIAVTMQKTLRPSITLLLIGLFIMVIAPSTLIPATGLFNALPKAVTFPFFRPSVKPRAIDVPAANANEAVASSAAAVKAGAGENTTLPLQDFVSSVTNGQADHVVGVYVPGVLALPVGQQPKGNAGYVTREKDKATQFSMARKYGTVGILAHNDLAGEQFSGIQMDNYAIIVYGDGRIEYYVIEAVQKYQALSPTSTFSDFVNLDGSNEKLTASQLFNRVYGPGGRLVFQTCLAGEGDPSWGRMFIIARPATSQVLSVVKQTSFLLDFASFGLASN